MARPGILLPFLLCVSPFLIDEIVHAGYVETWNETLVTHRYREASRLSTLRLLILQSDSYYPQNKRYTFQMIGPNVCNWYNRYLVWFRFCCCASFHTGIKLASVWTHSSLLITSSLHTRCSYHGIQFRKTRICCISSFQPSMILQWYDVNQLRSSRYSARAMRPEVSPRSSP